MKFSENVITFYDKNAFPLLVKLSNANLESSYSIILILLGSPE